ncbi:hypothetical protein kac65v162_gp133 [Nodularia phage vB_NspS-kac65v162]|uniref:Uncharacterized protein n=2 Tax=Ravarandavirus kac65v151 TaxID=2845689 RepID=A0A482MHW8_9CAUD|nr:hypothetical protein HWC12_gp184 [Nodularia phage vB_NspS-kac65v151]QBQ73163.1 hypothetical protein kac65v151_gp133 [Nodularia phage vB_NspS-kac65v151]QBQ73577.1 hypothetical protein kac65v162_gp133 [Nodularia phage vB_NspS-kac65v162]
MCLTDISIGQSCLVKYGNSHCIPTNVSKVSKLDGTFQVHSHPNFPGLEKEKFTLKLVTAVSDPSKKQRHYNHVGGSKVIDVNCWVEFIVY